ncbi:carbohydrate porin, partial [Pseudomonas aeruginosa]|uniref:carbohydrate porin n=1 Tax=Pseudomonas aeruginosa TaxID=287 RepID=UPI0031B6A4AE
MKEGRGRSNAGGNFLVSKQLDNWYFELNTLLEEKTLSALNIRESDFWQPGTRAVMFSQPASQLLAGACMDVYVIRDGEGN